MEIRASEILDELIEKQALNLNSIKNLAKTVKGATNANTYRNIGAGLGAAAGGLTGAVTGDDDKKGSSMLTGAVMGGLAGAGGGVAAGKGMQVAKNVGRAQGAAAGAGLGVGAAMGAENLGKAKDVAKAGLETVKNSDFVGKVKGSKIYQNLQENGTIDSAKNLVKDLAGQGTTSGTAQATVPGAPNFATAKTVAQARADKAARNATKKRGFFGMKKADEELGDMLFEKIASEGYTVREAIAEIVGEEIEKQAQEDTVGDGVEKIANEIVDDFFDRVLCLIESDK